MASNSTSLHDRPWFAWPRMFCRALGWHRSARPRLARRAIDRPALCVECLEDRHLLSAMPLVISGAPGANNISVMFTSSTDPTAFSVTLNGTTTDYSTATIDKVVFIGSSAGPNEAVFDDPTSKTFLASLAPGPGKLNAQVVESAFEFDAYDTQQSFIYGTPQDNAGLSAASASDTFALSTAYSYVADTAGYFGLVAGLGGVYASGDNGIAFFYAAAGELYVATPTYNQLTPASGAEGSSILAVGFSSVYASGAVMGASTAYLYNGSAEQFVGSPQYSYTTNGSQILNIAAGFQQAVGVSAGSPTEGATLYDSADPTQTSIEANIVADGNSATLTGTNDETELPAAVTAIGFPAVLAISQNNSSNPDQANISSIDTQQIGSTTFHYSSLGDWQAPDATQITSSDVQQLLERAAAASNNDGAIIAVVDRGGNILGVRVENGVPISDESTLVYAIDGAVAEARAAAFFSSTSQALTSRTVEFISESTITQREVEANPNSTDPTIQGPGFVAPVGVGGNFPAGVDDTALVDLFDIEASNRDSVLHPNLDGVKVPGDPDLTLDGRFNADPVAGINAPESYGYQSGLMVAAQARGIGTLPGGVPLYKNGVLVGAIGVFFPGPNGYATYEQGFAPGQTTTQRMNSSLDNLAEFIALAAAGGSSGLGVSIGTLGGIPPVAGYDLAANVVQQIDLGGIALPVAGPMAGPTVTNYLKNFAANNNVQPGNPLEGTDEPINPAGQLYENGTAVPSGWLVPAHTLPGDSLTAADVTQMIDQGVAQAEQIRAQIRPLGSSSKMVFAVSDPQGNVLGLYRMPDATIFSIDIAVAKARNDAYYSSANLQPQDTVDLTNGSGQPVADSGLAFTSRTFRYLASPLFPEGVNGSPPGPFSILNDPGVNLAQIEAGSGPESNGENDGSPVPISDFTSVLGYDSFHPGTNFHDPDNLKNQNGVVFFPGSLPVYQGTVLIGGLGTSGDGVNQDDAATAGATVGFTPPTAIQADQFFVDGVRLPYQEYSRNALQL